MPSDSAFLDSGRFKVKVKTPPVLERKMNAVSAVVMPASLLLSRNQNISPESER
jgi:hypothetical protein